MIKTRANDIQRLNVLLRLPVKKDATALSADQWKTLLDDLYFVIFGERNREERLRKAVGAGWDQDIFHDTATPMSVRAAQEGLRGQLPNLQRGRADGQPIMQFHLSEQQMYVAWRKDGFSSAFLCRDFPTQIYLTLGRLFDQTRLTPHDLFICANPGCQAVFVPLRKPHAGRGSFCSKRCAGLIAARNYRKRNTRKLRSKERKRNRKRHAEKMQKRMPGMKLKIQERPRKRKHQVSRGR